MEFLASQYIVNAHSDAIHYEKFLDDLNHIKTRFQTNTLESKLSIGINSQASGNISRVQQACEHIVKKLYVYQQEPIQALNAWNP